MKKFVFALLAVFGLVASASARDVYAHDATVLPEAAKAVISSNFTSKVSVVKIEKKLGSISEYEVTLSDGAEISFDSHGNWKEIEVNSAKSVPTSLIPQGIKEFVSSKHAGQRIVGIEKDRKGYDVELSNGIELKFDTEAKFIRYDD